MASEVFNKLADIHRILIDIDGPAISFARADQFDPTRLTDIRRYRTTDFATATDCIMGFAKDAGIVLAGSHCVLVVSGAVSGDTVKIARCPWIISITAFRYLFQTPPLIVNDSAAMLWATTRVSPMTHRSLGSHGLPDFSKGGKWLGVNYAEGLGAALLVSDSHGGYVHVESEAGHCAFAPVDDAERVLDANLAKQRKPVSWERALFADANDRAWAGTDVENSATNLARKRCEILGSFAGDVILATAAWNGIFLFKRAGELLSSGENHALFLKKMENRANYQMQLRRVPMWAVSITDINLVGAAMYLDHYLQRRGVL